MRSLGTSTPRTRRRSAKTVCRRSVFFVSSFFVPSVLLSRNFVERREDFFACHLPQATCHSRQVWLRPCRARLRFWSPQSTRSQCAASPVPENNLSHPSHPSHLSHRNMVGSILSIIPAQTGRAESWTMTRDGDGLRTGESGVRKGESEAGYPARMLARQVG